MDQERNDRRWPLLRQAIRLHTLLYRLTAGRIGHRFRGGPSMLLLDHTGARSGRRRTTPLVYIRDGETIFLIASKGGYPRHPAWFHNLLAHPDTTVQIGSQRRTVRARVADSDERARLWPKAVASYPGYETYQQRTEREIPVVILEPRS
jgi:deazaflavin-dependent oxidoreductase (nitroreductase family)